MSLSNRVLASFPPELHSEDNALDCRQVYSSIVKDSSNGQGFNKASELVWAQRQLCRCCHYSLGTASDLTANHAASIKDIRDSLLASYQGGNKAETIQHMHVHANIQS